MEDKRLKITNKERWVVSNHQGFEKARQKGLYKGMISLAAKRGFKLCPTHLSDFVFLVADAIEQQMLDWHEAGGEEGYDKEQHLMRLESLLYMLEDLLPHHLSDRFKPNGKLKKGSGHTIGDGILFRKLGLVRRIVAFPPLVEKFYLDYEAIDAEYYRKSSVCSVCGEKQANYHYENIVAHEDCLAKKGWYRCEWCGWVYPNNQRGCERKPKCKERQLTRIKISNYD